MTSESQNLRNSGNKIYRSITDDLAPVVQRDRLEKCLEAYNKAMGAAYTLMDKMAAAKNLGMTSQKMFLFHHEEKGDDGKLENFYLLEALRYYDMALTYGEGQSWEWRNYIIKRVDECVEFLMTPLHQLPSEGRVDALERVVDKIPACAKTTVNLELAEALFKTAVKRQEEGNLKQCLRFLHECYRPLELAKQFCKDDDEDDTQENEIRVLEEDVRIQMSVAEAKKALQTGDDLLETLLMDEESLNIDMIWDIIDWFQHAIILARENEIEVEAIAYSRLGHIYDKILMLKTKAKESFQQCLHLGYSLHPKVVIMEAWFKLATNTLARYQQEKQRAEDEKWENKRKKYVEELTTELEKLKEICSRRRPWNEAEKDHNEAGKQGRKEFLEDIYKEFPPKNPKFKMPYINMADKTLDSMKKAYQTAVTHYHPDRQKEEHGMKWKVLAEEVCKELTKRYTTMK